MTRQKHTPTPGPAGQGQGALLRVSAELAGRAETIARSRRRATGGTDRWTEVAREAMAIGLDHLTKKES